MKVLIIDEENITKMTCLEERTAYVILIKMKNGKYKIHTARCSFLEGKFDKKHLPVMIDVLLNLPVE
jgi:hypothetical protein